MRKRSSKPVKTAIAMPLTMGNLRKDRSIVLVPVLLFIFSITVAAAFFLVKGFGEEPIVVEEEKSNIAFEMEIKKMVKG